MAAKRAAMKIVVVDPTAKKPTAGQIVAQVMSDGTWHSLLELSSKANITSAAASARVRDLRKPQYGGFVVERLKHYSKGRSTVYTYRLAGKADVEQPAEREPSVLDGMTRTQLRHGLDTAWSALLFIAGTGCTNYAQPATCVTRDAEDWCNSCTATEAIKEIDNG